MMRDSSNSTTRRWVAFFAVISVALGATACSEAESRDAPADAAAAGDVATAESARDAPGVAERSEALPEADDAGTPEAEVVETGTEMRFEVSEDVSTDTHEVGDRFSASLIAPALTGAGEPALPAGAESRWIVTESAVADGQALLAVELESIRVAGEWRDVSATVRDADIDTDDPDSGGETAAKIGVGTAAGAIVGQILGRDTRSTLTGAGVGAAVGTAVALSTRGGSARLPAESVITVELAEPLPAS